MRICLVSQEYPPGSNSGGIGSQTQTKAHGLAALGHEVDVISAAIEDTQYQYRDGPVRVTRLPGFHSRMPLNTELVQWLTYSTEVAATICALHAQTPFDLVDFPEWGCEGYIHLLNRTEWDRVPTVIHLHGPLMMFAHTMGWPALDSEFYRVGTAMEGLCLRLADAVFSSSDCSADWCARHYGLDRERIPTIHTGVDTRLFCPRDAPKETRPTVVFAGRVDPNKGITVLVDAACILAKEFPGLQVRIIGRGEAALVERLRAKSRRCGFPDLLDLTGYLAAPELAAHLRRAHVFAAPSRYEGGPGFVYLEAMACGLPVVGCQGSGAAEAIRHGETGFLVPPGDTGALVESLRLLLSHPDLREAMGARARSFVEAEADSKVCLKRLESFYSAVATGASRSCFASEARS